MEEGKKGNELVTVPAQENPVEIIHQTSNFTDPNYGYLPLEESEIVAPSNMLIVADKAGFIVLPGKENVSVSFFENGFGRAGGISRRHGKKTNITFMDGMRSRCGRSRL